MEKDEKKNESKIEEKEKSLDNSNSSNKKAESGIISLSEREIKEQINSQEAKTKNNPHKMVFVYKKINSKDEKIKYASVGSNNYNSENRKSPLTQRYDKNTAMNTEIQKNKNQNCLIF